MSGWLWICAIGTGLAGGLGPLMLLEHFDKERAMNEVAACHAKGGEAAVARGPKRTVLCFEKGVLKP